MSLGKGVWKGIRPINLAIIGLTCYAMRYLITPLSVFQSEHIFISERLFFFLSLSIILLAAGGNLLNDIEDIEVDAYNKQGRNPIPRHLGLENAWSLYFVFTLSGLLLGMISLIFLNAFQLWTLHLFIAGSLWFYSRHMQRQALIGNFAVAALCGLIPVLVLLYEHSFSPLSIIAIYGIVFYALQAFLLTFIREIAKDLEDMKGDALFGYRTFPVKMGIPWSKTLIIVLSVLVILLECRFLYELNFLFASRTLIYGSAILFFAPMTLVLISVLRAKTELAFRSCSVLLKWTMLCGLATSVFFHFL